MKTRSAADRPPRIARPTARRYVGCDREDLVYIELEALKQGGEQARADGERALREMDDIARAAEIACDAALHTYCPLDEVAFRDVFTRAWCAGYRSDQTATGQNAQDNVEMPGVAPR